MSIAEWDVLTALPGCAGVGCNLPGVVRLGGQTWCGGHGEWSFGAWFAADELERIERQPRCEACRRWLPTAGCRVCGVALCAQCLVVHTGSAHR